MDDGDIEFDIVDLRTIQYDSIRLEHEKAQIYCYVTIIHIIYNF